MVKRLVVFLPVLFAAGAVGATWTNQALPQAARVVATAFVVAGFLVGALGRRPDIRAHATVALAAAGVTAAGQTRAGRLYLALSIGFALASVYSIRAGRGAVTPRYRGPSTPRLVLGAVAAFVGMSLFVGLPPIARKIENRVGRYFDPDDMPVGFASRLPLGTTKRMMQSTRIVLRVHGEEVDYLRGAVLDTYSGRVWTSSAPPEARRDPIPSVPIEDTTTRIVFASGAPLAKPPESRWFLPANACNLHADGRIFPDGTGIARPETADEDTIAIRVAGCEKPTLAEPPPGPADITVGFKDLQRILAPIAMRWTEGASTDRDKIKRIHQELQRFRYNLEVQRNDHVDPVYDFLTIHKEGHCEMFASALALLARTQGIPTRLVSGYRVSERSPLFGHAVVRERNAHAWVQVWLEGRWQEWDPTPSDEIAARTRPGLADRLGDATSYIWDVGLPWILGGVVAIFALWYYGRGWVADLRARFGRGGARGMESTPGFFALESALARAGHARPPSEPIERFAARIVATEAPWADGAARALGAYAALRYGGVGDENTVARALEKAASSITSA